MDFVLTISLEALAFFAGMLGLLELGRRLGRRRLERDPEGARAGVAAAEGAVFALLGLLIAFSFSGAAQRFDDRRLLITAEANAIGTAWLRLDLLPAEAQASVRQSFRGYFDARLALYQGVPDTSVASHQDELWQRVITVHGGKEQGWEKLVLPALNEMFDVGTERVQATTRHPPAILFALLFGLGLSCALLAGFAMASASHRPLVHMLAFSLVIALTVYVILDLEHPRQGLIRVDRSDQVLLDLRASMR